MPKDQIVPTATGQTMIFCMFLVGVHIDVVWRKPEGSVGRTCKLHTERPFSRAHLGTRYRRHEETYPQCQQRPRWESKPGPSRPPCPHDMVYADMMISYCGLTNDRVLGSPVVTSRLVKLTLKLTLKLTFLFSVHAFQQRQKHSHVCCDSCTHHARK